MHRDTAPEYPAIALVGPYPPPFGGISVHLRRLSDYLEHEGIKHVLYNISSDAENPPRIISVAARHARWYTQFLLTHRCGVIHLYSTSWRSRFLFGCIAALRKGKYVLSIHGRSMTQALESKNPVLSFLSRWLLRQMDAIIASNPDIARDCEQIAKVSRERISIIPAFIPPPKVDERTLPEHILNYASSHTPLLSAVGWIGQSYKGCDLYGIDMMIALIQRLKPEFPRVGLIMSVNGGPEPAVHRTIQDSLRLTGDSICFVTETLEEFSPIAESSHLFLRPTNSDGDAVCIREALSVGTPVVTSDAVPRPSLCLLFKNRDMADFERTVRQALIGQETLRQRISELPYEDNASSILLLYEKLLKGARRGASE
jgi:glycosyltransferase involved in cell wall biosynthesis